MARRMFLSFWTSWNRKKSKKENSIASFGEWIALMSRTVRVWSYGGNFIKSTPIVKTVFYERQCCGDYFSRSGGADGSEYKNHALYFAERGCYDEEKNWTAKRGERDVAVGEGKAGD